MAKDTIEISSLQEGESRILTKNGNGYTVSKIEDNPDYDVTVILCAYSSNEMIEAQKIFDSMMQA